jgi:hypothetical protein
MFRDELIFLLPIKDMQCCKANKYDMHAREKKKGKLNMSSLFKGWKLSSFEVIITLIRKFIFIPVNL